ncbi:MAG TPA: hypothetical protein VFB43_17870 [Terracidiphilus sp.]|nr:hypothetical protein [Terracidiphilus sp.]
MKQHAAKEMRYTADVLDTDAITVLTPSAGVAIEDLSGRRLEQAQLEAAETTHMIVLRYADAVNLPKQGYLQVTDPGSGTITLYCVDYAKDPRIPRPRVWVEVYCHVVRIA